MTINLPARFGPSQTAQFGKELLLIEWGNPPPVETRFDSSGIAQIRIPGPRPPNFYAIERFTVSTTSELETECRIFIGEPERQNFVDGTLRGNLDVAEYPQGLVVSSGMDLFVVWSGGTAFTIATFRYQFKTYAMLDIRVGDNGLSR